MGLVVNNANHPFDRTLSTFLIVGGGPFFPTSTFLEKEFEYEYDFQYAHHDPCGLGLSRTCDVSNRLSDLGDESLTVFNYMKNVLNMTDIVVIFYSAGFASAYETIDKYVGCSIVLLSPMISVMNSLTQRDICLKNRVGIVVSSLFDLNDAAKRYATRYLCAGGSVHCSEANVVDFNLVIECGADKIAIDFDAYRSNGGDVLKSLVLRNNVLSEYITINMMNGPLYPVTTSKLLMYGSRHDFVTPYAYIIDYAQVLIQRGVQVELAAVEWSHYELSEHPSLVLSRIAEDLQISHI